MSASNKQKPAEINPAGLLCKKHLCRVAYYCYRQAETESEFFTLIAGASVLIDELPQFDETDKQTYRALCLALREEFRTGGEKTC
ncbi:MAG: hypothetical protein Q4Q04_04410 [Methanocorpusculum sp.]|nr:hypothetical protein [Methanocorpusculum sp.]